MDVVSKSTIRLVHWIEHNIEHLKSYSEVADTLEKEGSVAAAKKMRDAMQLVRAANLLFEEALDSLKPESSHDHSRDSSSSAQGHPREYRHEHMHKHVIEHTHDRDHIHEHSHVDSHPDDHEHAHKK